MKQMMNKKAIDRALGGLPDHATPKDIFQTVSQLPLEAQESFIKSYMPAKEQESLTQRQNISSQMQSRKAQQEANKSAALEEGRNRRAAIEEEGRENRSKREMFNSMLKEDFKNPAMSAADKKEILKHGSEALDKGASPGEAYSHANQVVQAKKEVDSALDSFKPADPNFFSWGQGNKQDNLIQNKQLVDQLKQSGMVDDDSIIKKLKDKGYTISEIVEQFGLTPSEKLVGKVINKPMSRKYKASVLARAGGDVEKAKKIAADEGYNTKLPLVD
jgi:hypothetical protein